MIKDDIVVKMPSYPTPALVLGIFLGAIATAALVWLKINGHINNWGIIGIILLYSTVYPKFRRPKAITVTQADGTLISVCIKDEDDD